MKSRATFFFFILVLLTSITAEAELKSKNTCIPDLLSGFQRYRTLQEVFLKQNQKLLREGVNKQDLPYLLLHEDYTVNRPIFIVLHGMGESPRGMKQLSDFYFKKGYHVLTLLFAGHGRTKEALHEIGVESIPLLRAQVQEAIALATSLGGPVILSGYSFGGLMALDAALRVERTMLQGLHLLAPAFSAASRYREYAKIRIQSNAFWLKDDPLVAGENDFSYDQIATTFFATYLKIAEEMSALILNHEKNGKKITDIPSAIVTSQADHLVNQELIDAFIKIQKDEEHIYPKANAISHLSLIRPIGNQFDSEFISDFDRLMEDVNSQLVR